MSLNAELTEAFGPIDATALSHIRNVVIDADPLVEATAFDDPLNPRVLQISLGDGIAAPGRIDVSWSETGYYSAHYTEPDLDCRFDYHPKPEATAKHFHPPPDAPSESVEPSCIRVDRPELVGLAVLQRWRAALDAGDPAVFNEGEQPP